MSGLNWVDRVNQTQRPEPPPRSGKGSGVDAWQTYATAIGYDIPEGTARAGIWAIMDAGPPPPKPSGRVQIPKVEGQVYAETKAAVEAAEHLTDLDRPYIAVLLDLAKTIDGMPFRPASSPLDNVTIPIFHRYAESLGFSPLARAKLEMKPERQASKLGHLRAIRGGRADG